MNTVQPIRDKSIIEKFKNELLKKGSRDYMMFVIGINADIIDNSIDNFYL